jgi:teichuronic acid biosynthesis glycosyltransferase TuaC
MFPNSVNRNMGIFVKERLLHVARKVDLTMIAPVPSFPFIESTKKYYGYKKIQLMEECDGLTVFHPRYFMIPKYFKFLDASFYEISLRPFISNAIAETNCDVLDVHWVYPDGFAALEWARRYNKKVVVTVRGNEAIHYYQDTAVRNMIVNKMHLFDHVISVSDDLKNKLVNEYQVSPDKISVIHNGVDKSKFVPMDKAYARSKCGLTDNCKYILSISRLSSEKGLDILLEAMVRLKKANVKLVLVGDGPLYNTLNKYVYNKNLSDRVNFVGSVPHNNLCHWYNAADVFCLPSLWEGCPNVVIEALACGTPVVSSSVGAVPHFVNFCSGMLVPPGEADSLANALEKLTK